MKSLPAYLKQYFPLKHFREEQPPTPLFPLDIHFLEGETLIYITHKLHTEKTYSTITNYRST